MARLCSRSDGATKAMAAVVVMMMALAWGPSMGRCSRFITFAGPGCNNLARAYSACGCSNIAGDSKGGYQFTYQGQTAYAYNQANCQGTVHTRFNADTSGCSPFGWQSFFILC